MNARTTTSTVGTSIVVAVEGVVDLSSVGTLHTDVTATVRRHPGETVLVDLDGVRGLDDAGLGVLLGVAATARDLGGDLVVVCADEAMRRRLARTRLDRALEVRTAITGTVELPAIYHLALPDDWAAAHSSGEYRISTRGRALDGVGFIHCAHPEQIEGVATRFYADLDELLVLTVDRQRVGSPIVDERPAPDVDELFPHIYGPLPIAAVVATHRWTRPADGSWALDRAILH